MSENNSKQDHMWKKRLSDLQYRVTREGGTERAFSGVLYKEARDGTYRCICCQHILFTSAMKYDSGCGWPSFHTEHEQAGIQRLIDRKHEMTRIEVQCGSCKAHLGHIFEDGPSQHGGERYCINSASLTFEPRRTTSKD
ncbi:MAG TPA: peptide-methionine (R)-S-oxide reductase MsrB [Candidatus Poseidoniales archaeon]|nr:peptide-methionine (R)-S-oxide reductase MsrB [Candidatus Poseidoniales archaeon]